jgi:hypothetical protein
VIRARIPPSPQPFADLSDAAFRGYGESDPDLVASMTELYGLYQTAWWLAIARHRPTPRGAGWIEERLAWWRSSRELTASSPERRL